MKNTSRVLVALFLVGAGVLLSGLFMRGSADAVRPDYGYSTSQLMICQKDVVQHLKSASVTLGSLEEAGRYCYAQLYNLATLNEFQIRREKYIQQTYDEHVLLWMVVVITITGVALAGLQLVASYKLAASGQGALASDSELVLERSKMSIKSSITGLLILVLSFAFFVVFVYEIYRIKDAETVRAYQGSGNQTPKQIGAGTLIPDAKK
jgi:hypothetical protein